MTPAPLDGGWVSCGKIRPTESNDLEPVPGRQLEPIRYVPNCGRFYRETPHTFATDCTRLRIARIRVSCCRATTCELSDPNLIAAS